MTRRLLLVVPLMMVVLVVVAGCGGGGAPQNVFVEGFFRCWAPQLFPTSQLVENQVSAQHVEDSGEPIALTDTFIEFDDNGTCHMEGAVADQSDLADVQTQGWWGGFSLDGTWYQEDNIVYASLDGVGSGQVSPSLIISYDYAGLVLEFANDSEANGELTLGLWGEEYRGAIAITEENGPF
jgi:hypothetical protein